MSSQFYELKVSSVIRETIHATTLYFEVPEELKSKFTFKAGQYLTLKFDYKGEELRRAYSISSSPVDGKLSVTSKRVTNGKISNHINDNVSVNDLISVMPPDGNFTLPIDHDKKRDHYFFAAGSGITPIFSIVKTILEEEPMSKCHLLFGNTNEENIIYEKELQTLIERYSGQFFVRHILSQPIKEKKGGLGGLFKKATINWTGWQGRINEAKVNDFFKDYPLTYKEAKYFICGPSDMIENVKTILKGRDISDKDLIVEYFGDGSNSDSNNDLSAGGIVKMKLNGKSYDFDVSPDKTILDAAIDAGYDVPYSCTSGACSTCVAKVHKGSAVMDACYALDDAEIADGYILTCQAHPTSPTMEIEFEK